MPLAPWHCQAEGFHFSAARSTVSRALEATVFLVFCILCDLAGCRQLCLQEV